MTDDSADWAAHGTLIRVARAGSGESVTILMENAPLWALIARVIETDRYASFMGAPWIEMKSRQFFGPEEIKALAAAPDRWTEPHPVPVPK